ncbi:tyrosine-type recombinase/integrase [Burkholderia vietnamiensis]|uniref:tyrosine-type recombinase/integrase n=1 Tax=Burkholderia vietnamiensis TaxID=60552 RepID=UPI00264B70B9|nr:site-specific integrase [Burkholderia vietnamiensis]MDN8037419.1 site-specific integrase [Burkholderia vietnamiensis]
MKTIKTPQNLTELLRVAGRALWRGKAYELTAYRNVEHFIAVVGDLTLGEIRTTTIDDFVNEVAGTLADSTVNRKLTNVHSVLKYAHDREWLAKMPKFAWKAEDEGRVRWITAEEEILMFGCLAKWGEDEVARFIAVLLDTGMRRGELLKLQPKDVDGPWVRLWVNKTKKARSVPLTERAEAALAVGLPFRLDENKLRQVWDKLRSAMGLEDDENFVLHALRHTAATRTLAKTGNIAMVQKLLGHRKIETTMRYAHISDEDLLSAVR